jgi:hypothetical protein
VEDLEQFLNFALENLSDPRIEFYKKMKYGYSHYYINIRLKYPEDVNSNDSKTLQIIVDCRNSCIEVGHWEDLLVFEDYELTKKWADKLELVYKNRLSSHLQTKILKFFDNVAPKDKDFGRRWKMKDWFNDDEEKENPTE